MKEDVYRSPEQTDDRGHFICTYSGARFFIDECNTEDIPIEDIAHALAFNCRFNGHLEQFYSVAEHSVNVSLLVPEEQSLWGLLHDVSEAFVPDMPRPFKQLMPEFQQYEDRIMQAVAKQYGLEWPMPKELKYIDNNIVAVEADVLFREPPEWTKHYPRVAPDHMIVGLAPGKARRLFLERYEELTK